MALNKAAPKTVSGVKLGRAWGESAINRPGNVAGFETSYSSLEMEKNVNKVCALMSQPDAAGGIEALAPQILDIGQSMSKNHHRWSTGIPVQYADQSKSTRAETIVEQEVHDIWIRIQDLQRSIANDSVQQRGEIGHNSKSAEVATENAGNNMSLAEKLIDLAHRSDARHQSAKFEKNFSLFISMVCVLIQQGPRAL